MHVTREYGRIGTFGDTENLVLASTRTTVPVPVLQYSTSCHVNPTHNGAQQKVENGATPAWRARSATFRPLSRQTKFFMTAKGQCDDNEKITHAMFAEDFLEIRQCCASN